MTQARIGRDALIGFAEALRTTTQITCAECWTHKEGWRGAIIVDGGQTVMLPSRAMRRLAEKIRSGAIAAGQYDDALTRIVEDMLGVAAEVKRKNAERIVPDGAPAFYGYERN